MRRREAVVDGALHTAVFSAGALQQGEGIGPEVERATAVLVVAVVVVVVVEKCGRLSGRPSSPILYIQTPDQPPLWRPYW